MCGILGMTNPSKAVSALDDDEKDGVSITDAIGRKQKTTIINEPGLYSLILRSRKPAAKTVRRI